MISGWGRHIVGNENSNPEVLLQATVDIVDPAICQADPQIGSSWGPNQICTSDNSGDVNLSGACQGDSGGPLSVEVSEGVYEVWGATSYGVATCDTTTGTSGVWAMAWGVKDWIDDVSGGECPRN